MQTRELGKSGIRVSAIGLGGMPLSISDTRPSEVDAIAVIQHAVACGITFLDTADAYCLGDEEFGHNERLFGKALAELPRHVRESVTVATKCGLVRPEGRWERDGSVKHIREATEASLRNLRVETLTLQQYHRIDPKVPLEESWGELVRLQQEGKIRFLGASNHSVAELERAARVVPSPGLVSLQNQYSRKHRNPEVDGTLSYTRDHRMAFLPWSPLDGIGGAKGLEERHPGIARIAKARGISAQQVALAWLLSVSANIIAIPGASKKASVEDSAKAADLVLSPEDLGVLGTEPRMTGAGHN